MARTPAVLVLLGGVWLIVASFVLDHRGTGDPLGARTNDVIVGGLLAAVALARILAPARTGPLSMVGVLLGVWLVAAPFVLRYNERFTAVAATWNDILVGVIVVMLAGVSWFAATGRRRDED